MTSTESVIKVMIIKFNHKISTDEIPKFRGALIATMEFAPVQFHNHGTDGLQYNYPLVQYKRINGKAAIICVEEAINNIGCFLSDYQGTLSIGRKVINFPIENISIADTAILYSDHEIEYQIENWLPCNQENYAKFQNLDKLSEKCLMLENILASNILSFAKGVGIFLDFEIKCDIQEIIESKSMRFKNVKMVAFTTRFRCNINLPDYIGLGKGVSHGFGVLKKL